MEEYFSVHPQFYFSPFTYFGMEFFKKIEVKSVESKMKYNYNEQYNSKKNHKIQKSKLSHEKDQTKIKIKLKRV